MPKGSNKYTSYTYKPTYESTVRPRPHRQAAGTSTRTNIDSTLLPLLQDTENLSVSELINHLRQHQVPVLDEDDSPWRPRQGAPTATVHPSLQGILGTDGALPPRPRLPRGIAAPDSWRVRQVTDGVEELIVRRSRPVDAHVPPVLEGRGHGSPRDVYNLPGMVRDDTMSLMHIILRSIVKNFEFHVEYDRYYLWELRPGTKSLLLSYLAVQAATRRAQGIPQAVQKSVGLNAARLRVLFEKTLPGGYDNEVGEGKEEAEEEEEEIHGIIGTEEITHLNLGGAIGYGLSFKDLTALFKPDLPTTAATPTTTEEVAESWEDAVELLPSSTITPSLAIRFPALTHLSLANPHPSVTYTDLLKFTSCIPTITHLSLAAWPCSSLARSHNAPASITAPASLAHNINCIRRLSRELLCLQYLDVSDCDPYVYRALEGVEWNGCWRKITTVVVRQTGEWTNENGREVLERRRSVAVGLMETVKEIRKAGRGEWCTFVAE